MSRSIRFARQILFTAILPAALVALGVRPSAADDLKLKDGTTVSGSIVGFEDGSFKVRTSYGYALVEKDKVLSIAVAADAETPVAAPEKKIEVVPERTPAPVQSKAEAAIVPRPVPGPAAPGSAAPVSRSAATGVAKTVPSAPDLPASPPVIARVASPIPAPLAAPAPPKPVAAARTAPMVAAVPAPSAAAPAPAAPPPAPEPIREAVVGNTYTNETYRFRMYKPPDWDVIAAAPTVMPGAITAMGTADDTTYLLIGQEPAGKSLATGMDLTEKRLRDVMENFRATEQKQITVSGTPVAERTFRGTVDEHDWSGVVVLVQRGGRLYTIFGMTRADNDLVQLQENVIARAISSLQFTEQQ